MRNHWQAAPASCNWGEGTHETLLHRGLSGADTRLWYLWYLPAILLDWLLGMTVARYFSITSDRALRKANPPWTTAWLMRFPLSWRLICMVSLPRWQ